MSRRRRLIGSWDRRATTYDERMAPVERRWFGASRSWVGQRATGRTLELAIGTGRNVAHYRDDVHLTGVDWSPRMVQAAGTAGPGASRPVALVQADAVALPFPADRFDTVVCTFSLCCIPDERAAVAEAVRVLRPGGSLLLADHIVASNPVLRAVEHLVELVSVPLQGEHYTRRPLRTVRRLGLTIVATERVTHGAIERVHARKPPTP